ncbi:unnamed protein product [Paramecium sonneborni]|uniref:Transmembrane protein n=1 Tax=Paramecium sonneborni TaxID=65129 RepID=A0A8S1M883_9CILI|nr:unnamed protein product [Paramecium sonneborni]
MYCIHQSKNGQQGERIKSIVIVVLYGFLGHIMPLLKVHQLLSYFNYHLIIQYSLHWNFGNQTPGMEKVFSFIQIKSQVSMKLINYADGHMGILQFRQALHNPITFNLSLFQRYLIQIKVRQMNYGESVILNYIYFHALLDAQPAFHQTPEKIAYFGILLKIVQTILILIALTLMDGQQIEDINLLVTVYVIILIQTKAIPLLGGFKYTGESSYLFKTINLPTHSQVKIQFRFMILDKWNSKQAYLSVDNTLRWTKTFNYNNRKISNICGDIYDDIPFNDQFTIAHTESSITLLFNTNLNQDMQNWNQRHTNIYRLSFWFFFQSSMRIDLWKWNSRVK